MATAQSKAVMKTPSAILDTERVGGLSDVELLARFTIERDEVAEAVFSALVRRYGPMVLQVCQQIVGDRHDAEDAFQAVFLILARKAGSIQQPELLGNWLHGVALRTAREARMRDCRRRGRESFDAMGTVAEPIDGDVPPDKALVCRETLELLHEEVARLPEQYRLPVILCDLQGLSYREVAQRLRCPVGTIGVRLKRARERLRARLTQRGVAPAAGLIGALAGTEIASACLSSLLVESTVEGAMWFGARATIPGGFVSTAVISLTERVLKTMALARLKLAMSLSLVIVLTAAVAWVAARREARALPAPAPTNPSPAVPQKPSQFDGRHEQGKPQLAMAIALPAPGNPIVASFHVNGPAAFAAGGKGKSAPDPTEALFDASRKREEAMSRPAPAKSGAPVIAAKTSPGRPTRDELLRGELLFTKEWTPNDTLSAAGDGLGPVYNDTSCIACHGLGAPGGAGPESKNVILVTANPNNCGPARPLDLVHPGFRGSRSAVVHRFGTDPEYATWRSRFPRLTNAPAQPVSPKNGEEPVQAEMRSVRQRAHPDQRTRERSASVASMDGFTFSMAERNTPALFGVGLIDQIPTELLVSVAALQPTDIKGRVGRTKEGRIGRFGWKAQLPSLHEFVRGACANELGLEVPGHSQAASPLNPAEKAKGFDLTEADCDALVAYVRDLPAPIVVDPTGPLGSEDMRAGRRLFADLQCSSCHMPSLGEVRGIYSDLLLHDMGQSLSDSGSTYGIDGPDTPEGPKPREWRTPPLWGYRDSGPYLHDGRAQTLDEAIAFHEGQAATSSYRFFALSTRERARVESFLKSLVAPAAAAAPGLALAAEMELRLEREDGREPEDVVRQRREQEVARDEQKWREVQQRRRAEEAAKRARLQIPMAQNLEKMGKINGALFFYKEIARSAAGTEEGRAAAARIAELRSRLVGEQQRHTFWLRLISIALLVLVLFQCINLYIIWAN